MTALLECFLKHICSIKEVEQGHVYYTVTGLQHVHLSERFCDKIDVWVPVTVYNNLL